MPLIIVSALLNDGKFPVTIGGNHTVSIGAFRSHARKYKNLTILQLDAHSDLRIHMKVLL